MISAQDIISISSGALDSGVYFAFQERGIFSNYWDHWKTRLSNILLHSFSAKFRLQDQVMLLCFHKIIMNLSIKT